MSGYQHSFGPNFKPESETQMAILKSIEDHRQVFGPPTKIRILRHFAPTRKHVRTIKPEGWQFK